LDGKKTVSGKEEITEHSGLSNAAFCALKNEMDEKLENAYPMITPKKKKPHIHLVNKVIVFKL